jgi:hypothetical protein
VDPTDDDNEARTEAEFVRGSLRQSCLTGSGGRQSPPTELMRSVVDAAPHARGWRLNAVKTLKAEPR